MIDYLFYRIYILYKNRREADPKYYAIAITTICLFCLLLNILFVMELFKIFQINKAIGYIILAIASLFTIVRYKAIDIDTLTKKYSKENVNKKRVRVVLCIIIMLIGVLPVLFHKSIRDIYGI